MVATNFEQSLNWVLKSEGGWTDDPHDPGGATMFGIIQTEYDAYLKKNGLPHQSVRYIHPAERDEIYHTSYWDVMGCDNLPSGVDYCVFDAAVNSGPGRAKQWLVESGHPTSVGAFCDHRLAFLKSLSTWQYFGDGWGNRVLFVRKNANALASGQPIHDTTWVQASLVKLGYFLEVSGKDDSATIAAIKKFQGEHGLVIDGQAGAKTCTAIDRELGKIVHDDIAKTAAQLCTGIYAYGGVYPNVTFDHVIQTPDKFYIGIKHVSDVDFVTVRGTVSTMEWLKNVEAWTVNLSGLGPCHYGFADGLDDAWKQIKAVIGDKFVICGHSRGAAQAKILSGYALCDGKKPQALIVFGAPRAGYQQLANVLKTIPCKSYRNTAVNVDPVTLVPFTLAPIEPFVDEIAFTDVSVMPTPDDTFPEIFGEDTKPHFMPLYLRGLNGGTIPLAQAA